MHAIWRCFSVRFGEVVGRHLDRVPTFAPLPTDLREPSHQLFFLRVHTDHRVARGQELRDKSVDEPELGVTIGMLFSFQGLPVSLQAVAHPVKNVPDSRMSGLVALLSRFPGEVASRL